MKTARKHNKNPISDINSTPIVYPTNRQSLPKSKDYAIFNSLIDWQKDLLIDYINGNSASIGVTADTKGIDKVKIAVALKTDKTFKKCYNLARKIVDEVELMSLEHVSTDNALLPKSTVERIFRLKSLNRERYADRGRINPNVDINITFGNGVNAYDVSTVNGAKDISSEKSKLELKAPSSMAEIVSKIQ